MRPMDPTAIDDPHDLFVCFAAGRHHLMDVLAQLLGITMGDDCREDFGGAVLDSANDAEQHPTGDAAPRAIRHPRLPFEGMPRVSSDSDSVGVGAGGRAGLCATSPRGAGQSATGSLHLHRAQ
jgi:hypothetical protein